jgi:HEAT repeat protein
VLADRSIRLIVVAVVAVCAWAVLAAAVVLVRIVGDSRRRRIAAIHRKLEEMTRSGLTREARAAEGEHLLRGLRRSLVDRAVIAAAGDPVVSEALAAHALARWGPARLLRSARAALGGKWRRIAAMLVLANARHPEAIDVLHAALADGDRDVVDAAVAALGRVPDRRAAEALVELLCGDRYPRSRVATVLQGFPLPLAEVLCARTSYPVAEVRFWAATLLASYGGIPGVEAAVSRLVDDDDPRVRKAAVDALGRMTSPDLLDRAGKLAADPVFYVRAHVLRALARFRQPELARAVAPALADSNWYVRCAAKESLTAMGRAVAPALVDHLDSSDGFARNGAAEVLQNLGLLRSWISTACGTGEDAEALRLVRKVVAAGGSGMIDVALEAAAPEARPRLAQLLQDVNPERARGV